MPPRVRALSEKAAQAAAAPRRGGKAPLPLAPVPVQASAVAAVAPPRGPAPAAPAPPADELQTEAPAALDPSPTPKAAAADDFAWVSDLQLPPAVGLAQAAHGTAAPEFCTPAHQGTQSRQVRPSTPAGPFRANKSVCTLQVGMYTHAAPVAPWTTFGGQALAGGGLGGGVAPQARLPMRWVARRLLLASAFPQR
jgi:hypothetical protein